MDPHLMDPEAHYGPMPPPIPASSLGMGGGGATMTNPMNPYGHSVPPPPGLSSHPIPGPGGPPAAYLGGGMGGGGMPKPLNTVQLQQLSAQIKAYRLLARNVPIPDALLSIVHGRKPTQAMLAQMYNQHPNLASKAAGMPGNPQQSAMSSQPSQFPQLPRTGSAGSIPSMTSSQSPQPTSQSQSSDSGGGNVYPSSPGITQSHSPSATQQKNLPSSLTVAPNVTLPPGGELPLVVKQAMSSAQTVTTSAQPPHSQPHTSVAAPPSVSVPVSSSQQSQHQSQPQSQHHTHPPPPSSAQQQQQSKMQSQMVKQVKLSPLTKPQGIDPTIIMQERETRCVCL